MSDEQLSPIDRPAEQVKWLTAKQAAALLGVSDRTALDYATKAVPGGGPLVRSKEEINKATNRVNRWLHAGDIERILFERENGTKLHSGESEPRAPRAIAAPAITVQMPAPEALPLFLTLEQAAKYSGLRKSFLMDLAEKEPGSVGLLNIGPGPGGKLRFSRAALDKFAGS